MPGEDRVTSMTKLFDTTRKLSIQAVTMRSWGKTGDNEATKQELRYIRELSEEAEDRGITLEVGPHTGGSVYNAAMAIQMLNEIDSPALGVTFDPKELYKAGDDPSEAVLKFGKKIVHAISVSTLIEKNLKLLMRNRYRGE